MSVVIKYSNMGNPGFFGGGGGINSKQLRMELGPVHILHYQVCILSSSHKSGKKCVE